MADPIINPFTGELQPTPTLQQSPNNNVSKAQIEAQIANLQQQINDIVIPTTGVSSFNGRTGVVIPESGDYTVCQVTGAQAFSAAMAVALG